MPDAAEVYARWRSSAQSSRFTPPSDFGEAGEGFVFWTHGDGWAFAYRLTFRGAIADWARPSGSAFLAPAIRALFGSVLDAVVGVHPRDLLACAAARRWLLRNARGAQPRFPSPGTGIRRR